MYLNFPIIAAGNFSNNGFLKSDNRTTTIEGGVISVYRPVNENPTPPPDPSAIPDQWVNSSKRNILSPAIYEHTSSPVDIYDVGYIPISPTVQQTNAIQSNTPQYYLLSGNYQATASQYTPSGIPEHKPAAVLMFDTGNRKAQRITGELVDYSYDIPLFETTTGLQSSYKLKLWYSFNNNVISCGIDIYNGDTKVEGFDMDNTDLGYTYHLDSEQGFGMLNYFIAGGDTVKQEATHGTGTPIIKNNLVIMDFIHAERISNGGSGNVTSVFDGNYNCYHCGVALDLNYLKTTYNVMLNSDQLTVEEVPDFQNNSYHVNLYHGEGDPEIVQNLPFISPGTGVAPDQETQMYDGSTNRYEPHIDMFDDDLGYYTKAVNPTILGISDKIRPFEYDIPLYDSNNNLSDYKIKIDYIYYNEGHGQEVRIYLSIYYQDTFIAGHNLGTYAPTTGNPVGPYFFAGADTFNTLNSGGDPAAIVETNNLLVIGFLQKQSTNSGGSLIDDSDTLVYGILLGFDLSYIEQTYGVHLSEDQLTTT